MEVKVKNDLDFPSDLTTTEPKIKPKFDNVVASGENKIDSMRMEEIETDYLDSEVSFKNHIELNKDVLDLQHNKLEFSNQEILLNKMESEIKNIIVPAPILSILENQDISKPELILEVRFEKSEDIVSCKIEKNSAAKQEVPIITSSTIKRNNGIHTNEKPFPCNFCGKKFASKRTMKRHETIHSKIENIVKSVAQSNPEQGNLLKGIVIWLVLARSVVQSLVRALGSNFSNTFYFISTSTPFQFLQIMLAIYRLPLRFFFLENFLFLKTCNFEPFCYVIKSVLLKREEEKRLF